MSRTMPAVAVIADAHFHDLDADFGFNGPVIDGRSVVMRSWADTRQSTRVYNESSAAFLAALGEVRQRGIRHVVLLGDYTDDGQRAATESLRRILLRHSEEFGISFYALPGNHDIFGPRGRHHTKEFLSQDGRGILVTSDARKAASGAIVSDRMYCAGYPAGLDPMSAFGYFPRSGYLHWETPFGTSGSVEDRCYEVTSPDGTNRYSLMDASYLVEPEPGLWLLMIDANVFEPLDGEFERGQEEAFIDSTSGGWNAMLRCKPFVISWIGDVCERARRQGKTLLAFSHYPVLDPFDDASSAERVLFGDTNVVRRTPRKDVEDTLLDAGLSLHFSGHLHVEGITQRSSGRRLLTNVAVPSLVAFPPAFKILYPISGEIAVETVDLSGIPASRELLQKYTHETSLRGEPDAPAFHAEDYGSFLRAHKLALVEHRYFAKEWPDEIAQKVAYLSIEQVGCLLTGERLGVAPKLSALALSASIDMEDLRGLTMIDLIADWYCLRQGAGLALPYIAGRRLALYRFLSREFGRAPDGEHEGSVEAFLSVFLGALGPFLDRAEKGTARIKIPLQTACEEPIV